MATSRQLEAFLAVSDHGSVRAAADHLGVSQPTLSKHIRSLESKLGEELFVRSRGAKARLSPIGQQLQREAREALKVHKRFSRKAARASFPQEIKVLVRHYIFFDLVQWIEDVRLKDIPTALRFEIVNDDANIAGIVARERNSVGLLRTAHAFMQPDILSEVMAIDTCSLYASPGFVEKAGTAGLPRDLAVLLPDIPSLAEWALPHLKAAGLSEDNVITDTPYVEALLRKVLAGKGAAIFMDGHVADCVARSELVRLNVEIGPLYLQFVRNREMDEQLAVIVRDKIRKDILRIT